MGYQVRPVQDSHGIHQSAATELCRHARIESIQEAGADNLVDKKICGSCWNDDWNTLELSQITWYKGATVEYMKNSPALLSLLVAVCSLIISAIALVRSL